MKSINKLKNYLENYTREKYFADRVTKIRKEIGIPKDGIEFPVSSDGHTTEDLTNMPFGIRYKNITYLTGTKKRTPSYSELLKPIPKIYQGLLMNQFINIFILYNKRYYEVFEHFRISTRNTVALIESRIGFLEIEGCCDCKAKVCENHMDEESSVYPVTIGISPYATQNEVVDIIKERWDYIQDHMAELAKNGDIGPFETEKEQLSQIRERKTESMELEDVLYETRKIPLKVLVKVLNEKTGKIFDEGEAGKMRSRAVNRREKK